MGKLRALKNYFMLSDYTPACRRQGFQINDPTDFSLFINAFLICVIGPNPCLPVGRGVIRDFWTFSEISNFSLDMFEIDVVD